MSWRTVVVTKQSKLEYKMGYFICRGEETQKVHMSEIAALIIETTAVSITAPLMCELLKSKINVIFCNEKHNPYAQLLPLHGSFDSSKKLKQQWEWDELVCQEVWTEIVRNKIKQQAQFLEELQSDQSSLLYSYIDELKLGDASNREGHSAKVYFNALFGLKFSRNQSNFINAGLDYGYAILLSAFNRAICANGYITQIGIWHRGETNPFNLSCDLIEPFRIIVDRAVFKMSGDTFTTEHKRQLQNLLNLSVRIAEKVYTVNDAIILYVKSALDALSENDVSLLKFYENI